MSDISSSSPAPGSVGATPPGVPFGYFVPASPQTQGNGFTLDFIFEATWQHRWTIVAVTAFFVLAASFAAVVMKPIYRAEIVVLPVKEMGAQRGLGSIASQLGGLAALAGLGLADGGRKDEAIAILESRKFTEQFIRDRGLLPILYEDDWDAQSKRWKSSDPDDVPTLWKAEDRFARKIRRISEDKGTGVITLKIEWKDPRAAAQWANELVQRLNGEIRARDTAEAQRSLAYLNEQLKKTEVVELRETIHRLIETEINRVMLTSVRDEYVLRILDPATPPDVDDYVRPKRVLMIVAALVLGLALSMVFALLRHGWREDVRP